ncbi:MerR family transcriptional regulator [Sphingopyxis sp. RIFCSPHIGHO2_12_FULL_65_19]|uniref:MerR family transcriptional regulator n=1 Tax=Sphingopyxis sp. RIFCSPHIGHO2_12_FULL_65_19 TaxID=1802172 RepID=UPI0008D5E466|nr:MerR family transcriptional regulator [Sphingopyxis sp. RIFCSPHIGHO2_12_FULL_65_19]OHD07895.1 MAG: MerR family transcriptional regulator [Sphingopyxis sp. RIFCSPHIGHO2_12_FULL_65_19]
MSGFEMSDDGGKAPAAMLAIGELAVRIGVPTHVLRYWETRFPQLKPLQRSGRRRYYRAEDVALAERIHHLLHVQGFTVEGARKALSAEPGAATDSAARPALTREALDSASANPRAGATIPVAALIALRQRLAAAIAA